MLCPVCIKCLADFFAGLGAVEVLLHVRAKLAAVIAGKIGDSFAGQTGVDPCKAALFAQIDRYLNLPETDRRIFQLLRRSLRAYDLDDMEILLQDGVYGLREEVMRYTDREWDEKMNDYISRYI